MNLYVCKGAPNPSKVRLYLAEKAMGGAAIGLPQIFISLRKGEHREPAHLARNPLAKLPVLELDDGSFLTESLAIIEFLEECFPQPAMIGETALDRARVRELERIADLRVLLTVGRIVHATKSPLGVAPSPEVVAHAQRMLPGLYVCSIHVCQMGECFWRVQNPASQIARSLRRLSLRDSEASQYCKSLSIWLDGMCVFASALALNRCCRFSA